MFKIKNCRFTDLPGVSNLEIDFSRITTLTGPNGTGKSTVLKVLDLAFRILAEREICDKLPSHEAWHLFKTAELEFECETPLKTNLIGNPRLVKISIECDQSSYYISGISTEKISIAIRKPVYSSELKQWEELVVTAKKELARLENELHTAPSHAHPQLLQQQLSSRNQATLQEATNTKLIAKNISFLINYFEDDKETEAEILRSDFISMLTDFDIPTVIHISTQQLMQYDIPALIDALISLKKGNKLESKKFKSSEIRLNKLLQSEIDISEKKDGSKILLINGIPYTNASTGTYLTLSFFALTESEDLNRIILWDEPENGLHPTRRIQLLELMRVDGRQFIIATHATEFAPVLTADSKVYRCITEYDEEQSLFQFSAKEVATRRDAFITLEALGIQPARTLFTSNVVIWIEGPTELIFYRHWLAKSLKKDGYQEGLHYSFMQYGGSLINYLSIADDLQLTSTIDLLSHCRHPIVLVDSDLKEKPVSTLENSLKPGARKILTEISALNTNRKNSALFQATQGREIENYLPSCSIWHAIEDLWSEFSTYKNKLALEKIDLGKYKKYPEAIEEFFIREKIVDGNGLAKGRSIWGPGNKVAMMASALSMPDFDESKLNFDCSKDLREIEKFIRSKHDFDYPNGLNN